MHYTISGNGTAVVLIHGFAEDHSIFCVQTELLQKKFKVLAVDLPSNIAFDPLTCGDLSMESFGVSINKILLKENIEKCIMIGHSMGGYVALAFAGLFPKKLIGLGLMHSNIYKDDEAKIAIRTKAITLMEKTGTAPFLKATFPGLFYNLAAAEPKIAQLLLVAKKFNVSTLVGYYKAMLQRKDSTTLIQNLSVPVLFIIGKHDKIIPFKIALRQSHLAPLSYVYILRGSAHMGMLEEGEKTALILQNFCLAMM